MNNYSPWLVFCVVLSVVGVAAYSSVYELLSRVQVFYAVCIVCIGLFPGIYAIGNRHENELIPLMPLNGLFYSFAFGLPVLSPDTRWIVSSEEAISSALLVTILGMVCLLAGYYVIRPSSSRSRKSHFQNVSSGQWAVIAWLFFICHIIFDIFPVLKAIASLQRLQTPLGYLSMGILFVLSLDKKLSLLENLLLAILIAFIALKKILSGSLAPAILLIIFFGVLYWNAKKRIPTKYILLTATIILLLNPIKMDYRSFAWDPQSDSATLEEKIDVLVSVFSKRYLSGNFWEAYDADVSTINRVEHISVLGLVIHLTPRVVPYWGGDSYMTIWTSYIPRILWPGKPKSEIGQAFGHRYGILHKKDKVTSINLPWLPEFYANFGLAGVVCGMFLVGILFRLLVNYLSVPIEKKGEHVLGVTVIFGLFYAESNLALMLGGVLTTYLAFLIILFFFSAAMKSGR